LEGIPNIVPADAGQTVHVAGYEIKLGIVDWGFLGRDVECGFEVTIPQLLHEARLQWAIERELNVPQPLLNNPVTGTFQGLVRNADKGRVTLTQRERTSASQHLL
jgi:hypothetical protein